MCVACATRPQKYSRSRKQIPCCHSLPREVSRENVRTFRWKCGCMEDAISIITHYVLTFSVRRTPMASSNRQGRSGKIIVEQPGGNVAITEGQHRDDYTLCSAMYQRIARHACLFAEHANINPVIRCLLFNSTIPLRIRLAFRLQGLLWLGTWKHTPIVAILSHLCNSLFHCLFLSFQCWFRNLWEK